MIGILAAWEWVKRVSPLASIFAIAMLAGLCDQFARRASANAAAMREQARQFAAAQALAAQAAHASYAREVADYKSKAMEAEDEYEAQAADARGALARYIAAHGMQSQTIGRDAGKPHEIAHDNRSQVSDIMSANTVMVSQTDLQVCTDAVTYGEKAHQWALSLNEGEEP